MSPRSKRPKEDVDYSPGHKDSHCGPTSAGDTGFCTHFYKNEVQMKPDYSRAGYCRKVIGLIRRPYWCKLFEKAK